MIALFEGGSASPAEIDEILALAGTLLLLDQTAGATRPRRSREDVAAELRLAIESALSGAPRPGFGLDGVRARPRLVREALWEVRRVRASLGVTIVERLNAMLPPASDFEATARLVVGGSATGTAFSDRNDVAIRLDAFVPREAEGVAALGGPVDLDRFTATLTHELFHVGFRVAGGVPPRPAGRPEDWYELASIWGPELVGEVWRASAETWWNGESMRRRLDAWVLPSGWEPPTIDRLLAVLSRLQSEGSAVWVEAPLRHRSHPERAKPRLDHWLADVDADFERLAEIVERATAGATPAEIERLAGEAFVADGPFYRVGYRMAERIERHAGRRPFLAAIAGGPLEFLETYLQTRPSGEGHVDRETAERLRRLIREIRAVGEFDPEA
jgi:hypothetical protein